MIGYGEKIKNLRKEKGLTQEQLADTIKIGRSALSLYETEARQPDPQTLRVFADYFNVSTDYLLGRSDDPKLDQVTDPEMLIELEEARKAMDEAADRYLKILEKHSAKRK